jgi:hypothetical protein
MNFYEFMWSYNAENDEKLKRPVQTAVFKHPN